MNFFYIKSNLSELNNFIKKDLLLSVLDLKTYGKVFEIKFKPHRFLIFSLSLAFLLFITLFYFLSSNTIKKQNTSNSENINTAIKIEKLENELLLYVNQVNNLRAIINSNKPFKAEEKKAVFSSKISLSLAPPIKGYFTERFSLVHPYLDIVAKQGQKIKTVKEGHVIFSEKSINSGNTIIVSHSNQLISVYKHCGDVFVKPGDFLKKYQPIAFIGNTGKVTTGPHLHLELWLNGKPINPEKYINFK